MVTGGGDGLVERVTPVIADKEARGTPGLVGIQSVEAVAGAYAGLAAGAFVQVDFEGVLLSGRWLGGGQEVAIQAVRSGRGMVVVPCGELFHSGKVLLLPEGGGDGVRSGSSSFRGV